MKFWKILRELLGEIFPEWKDKFISYKDLKKKLNLIYPMMASSPNRLLHGRPSKRRRLSDGDGVDGGDHEATDDQEIMDDFVELVEREINKFNGFFLDKEEEYVIRWKMLKDAAADAEDMKELMKVGRKMVDFHGEMILLENYSALNCIGLVKILKKHDKRSGDLIQLPFIQMVLDEPFFSTELINTLVKECEIMIYAIFSVHEQLGRQEDTDPRDGRSDHPVGYEEKSKHLIRVPKELSEIKSMENMYLRLTASALWAMKQIRSGSSTVSRFSLPPMQD